MAFILGLVASAAANSLWPGHLDTIVIGLGIVLGAGFVPVIVHGIIAAVAVVVGTASALARARQTMRAMQTVWRGTASNRVADYVAGLDAEAVRAVVQRDEIRDVSAVRGWLLPQLEIALRWVMMPLR